MAESLLIVPDQNAYLEALSDAQRQYPALRRGVSSDLLAMFGQMILDIRRDEGAGAITPERAEALSREVDRILRRFGSQANLLLTSGDGAIVRAGELVAGGHRAALTAAAQAAGVTGLRVAFDRIPERAVRLMAARKAAGGLSTTFKSLWEPHLSGIRGEIDSLLVSAVGRGVSADRATLELMYLLARDGDPDILAEIGSRGLRGRRTATALERLRPDLGGVQVKRLKELFVNARRIVVTETNQALSSAHIVASAESPVVALLLYSLSGRHAGLRTSPDVCDILAAHDVGYGPGLYRPEVFPSLPHPYCACFGRAVVRPASEWSKPKPSIIADPRTPGLASSKAIMTAAKTRGPGRRNLTPRYVARQTEMARRQIDASSRAYRELSTP
mgnify:CR=1 FL=1